MSISIFQIENMNNMNKILIAFFVITLSIPSFYIGYSYTNTFGKSNEYQCDRLDLSILNNELLSELYNDNQLLDIYTKDITLREFIIYTTPDSFVRYRTSGKSDVCIADLQFVENEYYEKIEIKSMFNTKTFTCYEDDFYLNYKLFISTFCQYVNHRNSYLRLIMICSNSIMLLSIIIMFIACYNLTEEQRDGLVPIFVFMTVLIIDIVILVIWLSNNITQYSDIFLIKMYQLYASYTI